MWMVRLLGCVADPLLFAVDLDGPPRGLVLTPDDRLAITHVDAAGLPRLAVFNRTSGTLLFSHPAGPGAPVVGDGRIYILTEGGLLAFRGTAIDWEHRVQGRPPATAGMGLTQDGMVVFGTQSGGLGSFHAVTHLGFPVWSIPLPGVPRGRPATDGADRVHLHVFREQDGGALLQIDGASGTVLWELPGTYEPLAALRDGVLARSPQGLVRIDGEGEILWSLPSGFTSVTLVGDGTAWATGPERTVRVDLETGSERTDLAVLCGPAAVDLLGDAWALCNDASGGGVQLTSLSDLARPVGVFVPGNPVDAPLLVDAVAYSLTDDGLLTGFVQNAEGTAGPWSRAHGGPSNDRRYHP